ncbi:MAG: hypothetical protein PHE50_00555 [Dehalococcoidales bacterium]|nr:hypothetical protein [Dehalococcoidales bacterium]
MTANKGDKMFKTLYNGIDTLVIGFNIQEYLFTERDIEMLECEKLLAKDKIFSKTGSPITLYGKQFNILPKGASGYEWIIKNEDVDISIARFAKSGKSYPEVYVTFSSSYLARVGYQTAYNEVWGFISLWAVVIDDIVSRADLCVDRALPEMPKIDIQQQLFCRARSGIMIEQHSRYSNILGYSIGKGDIMCRIYDKTREIVVSQKEWFKDVWDKAGWDGAGVVVRTEFQFRRGMLKEFGIKNLESLKHTLADMWNYATNKWLTIREISLTDKTRSRWKLTEFWSDLASWAGLFGDRLGLLRLKVPQVISEHLIKQSRGCLISAIAREANLFGIIPAIKKAAARLKTVINSENFYNDVLDRMAVVSTI